MTFLVDTKDANFGGSAIICTTPNPADAPSAKIPFMNSEKIILGVNNLCTNIRVYSDLLGFGFRVSVRAG